MLIIRLVLRTLVGMIGLWLADRFVNGVNITGNEKTRDFVIRRELPFAEGDPFNRALVTQGKSNIEALSYFSRVGFGVEQGGAKLRRAQRRGDAREQLQVGLGGGGRGDEQRHDADADHGDRFVQAVGRQREGGERAGQPGDARVRQANADLQHGGRPFGLAAGDRGAHVVLPVGR